MNISGQMEILNDYGSSAVDYFKTTNDKNYFFEITRGFISYRNTKDFCYSAGGTCQFATMMINRI